MTRHYGSITTSIWEDEDWWELTGEQQRVYLMLVTQHDITSVGTLPLTLKRWANSTKGCTIDGLSITLQELADARYIIVDWPRELLLVRSFVRWDKGYTNSKRLKSIQSSARAIASREMGGVLAHELNRLNIPHDVKHPPIDALSMAHRSPIDEASMHAGSGYVSNYLPEPEPEPETGNQNRGPVPADVPSAAAGKPAARPTRIPDPFIISLDMRRWADETTPGLDIDWHTQSFIDFWRGKSGSGGTKLDWVATWRNWMRSEHDKPHARRINGHGPPTRHDENAAVVEQMRQMERASRTPALEM